MRQEGCEDGDAKGRRVERGGGGKFEEGTEGTKSICQSYGGEERAGVESGALRHSAAATLTDSYSLAVCAG